MMRLARLASLSVAAVVGLAGLASADDLFESHGGVLEKPLRGAGDPVPPELPGEYVHQCDCGDCVHPRTDAGSFRYFWIKEEDDYLFFYTYQTWYFRNPSSFSRCLNGTDIRAVGGTWHVWASFGAANHGPVAPHDCKNYLYYVGEKLVFEQLAEGTTYGSSVTFGVSFGWKTGVGPKGPYSERSGGISQSQTKTVTTVTSYRWTSNGKPDARWKQCVCGGGGPVAPTGPTQPTGRGAGGAKPTTPPGGKPKTTGGGANRPVGGDGKGGGPKRPAGPKAPRMPKRGAAASHPYCEIKPQVNYGTIGAGDQFSTAVSTLDAATAEGLRQQIESGEVVLTQNGVPVSAEIIPTPQHVTAFEQDPDTTIYVKSTLMPSDLREIEMALERRDNGETEVLGSTKFLSQPRGGIFQDPATGEVKVVVTGTQTPWGDMPDKLEFHSKADLSKAPNPGLGDPNAKPGSTFWDVLKGAGFVLTSVGTGVVVAELTKPDQRKPEGGVPRNRPPQQKVPNEVITGSGTTPDKFVRNTRNSFTTRGHNSLPTGAVPSPGRPAITRVSGATAVVANPNSDLAHSGGGRNYAPAVAVGDVVTAAVHSIERITDVDSKKWVIEIREGSAVVSRPAIVARVSNGDGVEISFEVPEFPFGTSANLSLIARSGSATTPPVAITTVVRARPLSRSESTVAGGIVTVRIKVDGVGSLEQWTGTPTSSSPNVSPVDPVIFGEGSGEFDVRFRGDALGTADVRVPVRRVGE